MKCPNCGAEIDDDAKFCTECGTKIEAPKQEDQVTSPSEKNPEEDAPTIEPTTYFPAVSADAPTATQAPAPSAVAPKQAHTVSAGKATQTEQKHSKVARIILIVFIAILIIGAAGFGGWWFYTTKQQDARSQEVTQLEDSYNSQVSAIDVDSLVSNGDRSALLDAYNQLADIQSKVDADQKDGKFTLSNGSDDSKLKETTSAISDKQKKIFDWFLNDYKNRLRSNSIDASQTTDNADETDLNNKLGELKSLQNNLEDEKVIWASSTDKDATYNSFNDKVNDQINKVTSLLKGKKSQDKQDAQASKSAVSKWVGTYTGIGTDNKKLEIVLKSDGTVTYREGDTKTTEGTWTGDENTVKISFGGRISSRSEPFTITSKDGGRTIAVSSDSGTWQTDYLTKR
ncbi:MAG: zinc-ribbon domain-containing protein [Atopobiaceae bacterium]|nr:zinc-ribbon domain-containing protein [Atopobiaceae bacterium]